MLKLAVLNVLGLTTTFSNNRRITKKTIHVKYTLYLPFCSVFSGISCFTSLTLTTLKLHHAFECVNLCDGMNMVTGA